MSNPRPTAPGCGAGASVVAGNSNSDGTSGSGTGTVSATGSTTSKNPLQQLPAGAVLAYQAMAGTFTNQGNCLVTNWWLTVGLVTILSSTCIFFSFTDSIAYKGKLYYGVAIPGRLNILNMPRRKENAFFKELHPELKKRGLTTVDWVHAALSLVVFLTIAGSDVGLQQCFFPNPSLDAQQWLRNLPLGMAVMTTFLFTIFPTTRKGIRFDNSSATQQEKKEDGKKPAAAGEAGAAPSQDKKEGVEAGAGENTKVLMSSTGLMKLLPAGPVLAFQTLAASFNNQGKCLPSNRWLTTGLVAFLTATCIFSSFTDCVLEVDTGKPHWGVALPRGLRIMNMSRKKQAKKFNRRELWERRLKMVDWIHAFFSAVVFLTIAGSDVGLQKCFFPKANEETKQLLKNLPLGMAVMSSFVFMVFPTTRNSMCFDDSDNTVKKPDDGSNNKAGKEQDGASNHVTA